MKEYAIYKGEECLAIGTIKELAKKLKVKERTIYFYTTPTYKKRVKDLNWKNYKTIVRIDNEVEE